MNTTLIEDYVSLICPICQRPVRVVRIYAPSQPGLKLVGIKHDDHIVVIKFDKYGVARDINAYKLIDPERVKAEHFAICKRCKRSVPLLFGRGLREYAIDHDDHFVIIFLMGKTFVLQVIDKIPPIRIAPRLNIVARIRKEIGLKNLAMILYYAITEPNRVVNIPAIVEKDLKFLLREIFGWIPLRLRIGPLVELNWVEEADFFQRKILQVLGFSDKEALTVLKESVEMIINMTESFKRLLRKKGVNFVCDQLNYLKEKDPKLFALFQKLLGISCI